MSTSARLLTLLGLLQSRPTWTGPELAERLEVDTRTVRKDVDRLRELGYPVDAFRGRTGGYQLGRQGRLPPLLLADDEALAVAVGLTAVGAAAPGLAETGREALAKLERTLPDRLRRRVQALTESTEIGPANTGTNVADPEVDAGLLADLAAAIRDHEGVRFWYQGRTSEAEPIEADPYRLVSWQQRWHLVARCRPSGEWDSFRVDWMRLRTPGASRFTPDPLPGGDYAAYVLRTVAAAGWRVHARVLVDAPAAEVLARINPTVGVVETVDDDHAVLVTGADSWELVAVWIGMLGLDFHVEEPELVAHLRELTDRYRRALPARAARAIENVSGGRRGPESRRRRPTRP